MGFEALCNAVAQTAAEIPAGNKLVGAKNFKRHNPKSDRFPLHRFHHVEFWCVNRRSRFILSRWPRHALQWAASTPTDPPVC